MREEHIWDKNINKMKIVKINLHSIIDLITNSSTEIYTYSENSIAACKEMINEFFKVAGIDKTCDDIFNLLLDIDDDNDWSDYPPQSHLIISPKSPEYSNLAILVYNFLYSPYHVATYNG